MELTIRPSTVGSWMLCPGRPGQRGVEGYQLYPNEALLFGSGMHWQIEQLLAGEEASEARLETELHTIFIKDIPSDIPDVIYLSKVTTKALRSQMAKEILVAVAQWQVNVRPLLPDEQPEIEQTLRAKAGTHDSEMKNGPSVDVFVQGTPDVAYPEAGMIVDWKSAGRMWKPDKAEGQIQPIAYPWMYRESFGTDITRFVFWVYDRKGKFWAPFEQQTEGVDRERAEGAFRIAAVNAAVAIDEGLWTWTPGGQGWASRGWHCSPKYCDAWSVCWGKHLIADGKAEQKVPTLKERMQPV